MFVFILVQKINADNNRPKLCLEFVLYFRVMTSHTKIKIVIKNSYQKKRFFEE